jgi:hypothetical protein
MPMIANDELFAKIAANNRLFDQIRDRDAMSALWRETALFRSVIPVDPCDRVPFRWRLARPHTDDMMQMLDDIGIEPPEPPEPQPEYVWGWDLADISRCRMGLNIR